ncbi:MAG TPA: PBP1A family penicillin-binding protein [Caldithrix abyssi]|uniref:PBP1A family penicillin-binding protein n=1 Tax=Caldithrix abyssi TaxID=187145 RepID=A0A7V5VFE3_CALAY|nr:PBP1A family penicillin-binding protein [Caldithrix abyssi]
MKRKKRGAPTSTRIRTVTGQPAPNTPLKRSHKKRWLWAATLSGLFLLGVAYIAWLSRELPSLARLEQIEPAVATQVYSSDGELIHSFFTANRTYTPFEKIPPYVIQALISMEDRDFYDHWGVNLLGIVRALLVDIRHMAIVQGGGTLTMQLTRPLFFGREQKISRKIKEALTAIRIEKTYSKNEILEMYLNINDFGNNAFGIEAAAKRYFNKDVQDLTIEESALLIGILKGTSYYSPIRHPERAKHQRNVVMSTMVATGYLSKAEYDSLRQLPLKLDLYDPNKMHTAPYFTESVRLQLNRLQDSLKVNIYEDGLRVYTTLDTRFQYYMEKAIAKYIDGLQETVRKQRDFRELRETLPDSAAFDNATTVEIAFVAINPHNGHVLAMVGGRDFNKSRFNRVTQARRQPGSAFKPFLYTAAIDNGYSPAYRLYNKPTVEINADGTQWRPENYDHSVGGLTTLREALRRSLNLVAVQLINEINPRNVVKYARAMGITTPIRPYSSLALGSSEVIPIELVSAYGTYANNGLHVKPISIDRIEDRNGNVIYRNTPRPRVALSPETTQIVRDMMQTVMDRGTGYGVRRDFKFYLPAGGKTGTTNNYTDAWFVGYTADLVAGVWVGMDDPKMSLGPRMSGSRAALPFWGEFVKSVYDSIPFIHGKFAESPGVFKLEICLDSGELARPYCPNTVTDLFTEKNRPTEKCHLHTGVSSGSHGRKKRF